MKECCSCGKCTLSSGRDPRRSRRRRSRRRCRGDRLRQRPYTPYGWDRLRKRVPPCPFRCRSVQQWSSIRRMRGRAWVQQRFRCGCTLRNLPSQHLRNSGSCFRPWCRSVRELRCIRPCCDRVSQSSSPWSACSPDMST